MNAPASGFYPGNAATPAALLALANEYRMAAELLVQSGRRREPRSQAPFRMVAIHAIELYLNALLLNSGLDTKAIRSLHHNLAARADLVVAARLSLRKRTLSHLQALSLTREFLITRYEPGDSSLSELNRLQATLSEVANKVSAVVEGTKIEKRVPMRP